MTIRFAAANNHRKAFDVAIGKTILSFPFAKASPQPSPRDPVSTVAVDTELANEAFMFELASGRRGTVHAEQVLEYNQDPALGREQLLYNLTLEAQQRLAAAKVSKREIIRRLRTSASQFYRLIDQTNYRKSLDQVIELLHVLGCDVRVVVRAKRA